METDNPILNSGFEVADQTRHLSFSAVEQPKSKPSVSGATKRLIGELGLRYRPASQADLEAHAASLALLASDVSDIPPHLLEKAIQQHTRESHFMPKASDLIRIAKTFVDPPQRSDVRSLIQRLNDQNTRHDAHWVAGEDGTPHMEWRR